MDIHTTNIWAYISSYSDEVTGSNIYVKANWSDGREVKFVADCGLFQEKKWEENNHKSFPYDPSEVEFAIATHFHTDHIGRFPYLMNEGFKGRIYTTSESKVMFPKMLNLTADILLDDFTKNMAFWKEEKASRKKCIKKGKKDKGDSKCKKKKFIEFNSKDIQNDKPNLIFTKSDVTKLQKQVIGMNYYESFYAAKDVKVTFYPNGHLLGAAITVITLLNGEEELNILITGDYAPKNIVTGVKSEVPQEVLNKVNIIISESTYGASPKVRDTTRDYNIHLDLIKTTIEKNKKLVYMVNAIERPLVVLRELQHIMEHEEIGKKLSEYNIYFDTTFGLVGLNAYSKILGEEVLDLPSNFIPITAEDRPQILKKLQNKEPVFLMLTSPQFYHGAFSIYANNLLQDSRVNLLFCSYVSECISNTINLPLGISMKYNGADVLKKCGMYKVGHFSSHASISELEEFLALCPNKNTILFVHGTNSAKDNLVERNSKGNVTAYAMLKGKTVRVNKFGITKVY